MNNLKARIYSPYYFISLLFLFAVVIRSLPGLFDPYQSTGDQQQHLFWLYQFQDPELFKGDFITEFFSAAKVDPLGFVSLFRITSPVIDPLLLSKILAVILTAVSVIYIYRLADYLGGRTAGAVSAVLFICNALLIANGSLFYEGLPRSFAYPLLISFLFYAVKRDNFKASLILLVQALFYPPIFVSSAAFWGISCLRKEWLKNIKSSKLLIAGFIIAGSIIFYYSIAGTESLGSFVTPEQAKLMPEFGPEGRTKFFDIGIFKFLFKESRAGLNLVNMGMYILLLLPIFAALGTRLFRVNRIIYDVAISSFLLYIIAHLVLFKLFLPSRYIMYTMPIALNLLIAFNFSQYAETLKSKYGFDLTAKLYEFRRVFIIFMLVIILILGFIMVLSKPESNGKTEIYKFLNTLPKNVLISGYPRDMNGIPLYSKRKVLISHEHALPYYNDYYSEMREKTFDFFSAYYADNAEEIVNFCSKYDVDYLVINQQHFDDNFMNGRIYFNPFGDHAREIIKEHKSPYLKDLKNYKSVFEADNYSVLKCEKNSFNEGMENE